MNKCCICGTAVDIYHIISDFYHIFNLCVLSIRVTIVWRLWFTGDSTHFLCYSRAHRAKNAKSKTLIQNSKRQLSNHRHFWSIRNFLIKSFCCVHFECSNGVLLCTPMKALCKWNFINIHPVHFIQSRFEAWNQPNTLGCQMKRK